MRVGYNPDKDRGKPTERRDMYKYVITVYDNFFDKEFVCKLWAKNKHEAIKQAKDGYAHELDTQPEEIQIKNITLDILTNEEVRYQQSLG